jgi:DNA-binding MarR family transcriptional regulator
MSEHRIGGLQAELQQSAPFRTRTQEAFLSMLRTADVIKRRYNDLFEGEDVTFQQYNVLRILRGAGDAGIPTLEIGDRMIERQPGVTRIVDRLVRKGWVTRDRGTVDRRRVYCRITPDGLELLARLDGPLDETDRTLFDGMVAEDIERLVELLEEARELVLANSSQDD